MDDPFKSHAPGLNSPPLGFYEIAADDVSNLPTAVRGLVIETDGNVKVTDKQGNTIILPMSGGTIRDINMGCFVKVWATGTDAVGRIIGVI